jgi:TonB family protein
MRRAAWLLALACAACSPGARDPQFIDALARFDAEYQTAERELKNVGNLNYARMPDMRGRTMVDDLDQWVFTPQTRSTVRGLRERAAQSGAGARLEEARQLLRAEAERRVAIQNYWRRFPAPFWREHWRRFAAANGMPSLPPPPALLTASQQLVAQLDAGEFTRAADLGAPRLVIALRDSIRKTIPDMMKSRRSQNLSFLERSTPCGAAIAADASRRAPKVFGGPPVESFYPKVSQDRGEEGTVVLRLRISDKGCVRAGAVVVHSGFEELDSAALRWMETAQYSPGFADGRAVAGEASIKVVFRLED